MNILLMGFSTTGKSSILEELKKEIGDSVKYIDSDSEISKNYNNHIFRLFIDKHTDEDPENRKDIMDEISNGENSFLKNLTEFQDAYIAALGPNVHIRSNWNEYYSKTKSYVIFLKADVDTVYQGLIRREDKLYPQFENNPAFGNWNQGVIRRYNPKTKLYERLSENEAKRNISQLIDVNENQYSKFANSTFNANTLFKWHKDFDQNKKRGILEIIKSKIS
ncbi:MAG: shikimate kinase [Chitinophagales bacterium]